ncbi:nicotinate phosphoribosyltransferase [Breznakia sp. PF5-3]|uniref:nicotinate phosphoribosyltransferase n=1 Tax=unclassified Breznakia TaxID=2623764 RepID=UPI0024069750|nr:MULTISPECIES: nicotinate phosphoribosyltransferase [unclassified Breznakia]MDF9825004.1 nicotinate phosphoribosyltransferase [Breznakia sp. PM6-1]MDF9835425.1 nicotinate phosphoribosyltransferase [Breznakia sp. PF5-3]MDF9837657.1 nicotinate phosphoribosyltransferase [Breznakia sp. PFB2-8]MDF9859521.1 nicotinate phosphoribosyltransferase [Breznakia sp. PH5-24]
MRNYDLKFDFRDSRNLSLVMDLYELTMAQVYFNEGKKDQIVTFDMFYRRNPDNGGFALFAGLEEVIGFIQNLHFGEEEIYYLKSLNKFNDEFLDYLRHFIFTGDIYAMQEGSVVFPNEPLLRIEAKIIEAQIVETAILLAINHQTLIATKANRVVRAAGGRGVMEFGARRAHNFDAANYGARAAYIAGVNASATTSAGQMFGLPVTGTMAHSFIQSYDSEYEAFLAYAKNYPAQTSLLLDTYDTLRSGVKNAIKIAHEYLIPNGYRLQSVRIDSGDISYLSKKIRKELDAAGLQDCKIIASNSFDEYIIKSLIDQGAQIDSFGVGENLICSKSSPVFGGVYKLSSLLMDGQYLPKIKISDNVGKLTNPGKKEVYRIYDKESGKAAADLLTLHDEELLETKDLTIYHPQDVWKFKTFKAGSYDLRKLLVPIFIGGKLVYDCPEIEDIRAYSKTERDSMWDELFRFEYPQEYYVDLTKKLLDLKLSMLESVKK